MARYARTHFLLLIIALVYLLPGCAFKKNTFGYLERFPLLTGHCDYNKQQDNLHLTVNTINASECKEYFNVDILRKGYVPLLVTVKNLGNNYHVIRPSYIELPLQPSEKIAKLLHYNTSLISWSLGYLSFLYCWEVIPFYIVPGAFRMRKENQRINSAIDTMTMVTNKTIALAPYETIQYFMFVDHNDFVTDFIMSIFNEDQKTLSTFAVTLVCSL